MAFEYYKVEDELVNVVQSKINASSLNIDAIVFPDSEQEYQQTVSKPLIIIGFIESSFVNRTTNEVAGDETLTVLALIKARKKRGDDGCHHIAGLVKKWLSGYQTTDCGRLMFKGYRINSEQSIIENGVAVWELEFNCIKMFIQDPEVDGPLLNLVNLNDQIQDP